jgi:hypothetical protein
MKLWAQLDTFPGKLVASDSKELIKIFTEMFGVVLTGSFQQVTPETCQKEFLHWAQSTGVCPQAIVPVLTS